MESFSVTKRTTAIARMLSTITLSMFIELHLQPRCTNEDS
jgi:hypothetical protein